VESPRGKGTEEYRSEGCPESTEATDLLDFCLQHEGSHRFEQRWEGMYHGERLNLGHIC
jgi:hypothetical protein